jgi:hypothetical protein
MIDSEFDVRAYEEGYRAGKHDAQVEIDRLRTALEKISTWPDHRLPSPREIARAALGGDK